MGTLQSGGGAPFRVLVVGGLTRLDAFYRERERHDRVEVETAYMDGPSLERRVRAANAVVLVVGMISHPAMEKVRRVARREGTPIVRAAGPGVKEVRRSVDAVVSQRDLRQTA